MFSALRTRFGIPGVIATIALLFAMTGGAFAAKYLITSTKQISPSVLKKLKGAAGLTGAAGVAGTAGAQGPAGPAGANGANGEAGAKGATGATGATGTTGAKGATGPTGATGFSGFTEALPSGKTETGTWGVSFTAANFTESFPLYPYPISFPIPLPGTLDEEHVHYVGPTGNATCTGKTPNPTAPSGHLCIYRETELNLSAAPLVTRVDLESGAGVSGAFLMFSAPASKEMPATAYGSWAVTAP
jgi:hypothetical protein